MSSSQNVFFFGQGKAEGPLGNKELLGGKGANLAEMVSMGLPVPPGFTVSTEVCRYYYENKKTYPETLQNEIKSNLARVEASLGMVFGDAKNPLLVSVRSGASVSMPGMMDTVLNLGLNDKTVLGLAEQSKDARFAFDAYRRFIQMYGDVVLEVSSHQFETLLELKRRELNVASDGDFTAEALKNLVQEFKKVVLEQSGQRFPEDPFDQLQGAIGAVMNSWNSARAISYRRIHKISDAWGTAVNVQAMVFGNMGNTSATGVAFSRNPSTGDKKFFGEYLINAQGEDVVAGIRTPLPINSDSSSENNEQSMQTVMPAVYNELLTLQAQLEKHFKDMQDIEFTVQKGVLYLLQTRTAKRTAQAAVRVAVDMVSEGLIDKKMAVMRVTPSQVEQLLHPRLDPDAPKEIIGRGLPASPGAASGVVVFSSEDAEAHRDQGKSCVLVRHETSPEDISGMDASNGILTALGGMTSHAAVVARGMGKPCVAGCGMMSIDYRRQLFVLSGKQVKAGDVITIDGTTGEVILGFVPTVNSQVDQFFNELMKWVDEFRTLKIRANAETPHDVRTARQFGAEGVGLCRTEHMFFNAERIQAVREMILAESADARLQALDKIFPMQKEDFLHIFREMKGFPVTIRLLDPPLHEFLPKETSDIEFLASNLGVGVDAIHSKLKSLYEFNPMLGHRGCRLGISFPEIYRMQVRAIMEAACELSKKEKIRVEPEIMVPFVISTDEFKILKRDIVEVCEQVLKKYGEPLKYQVGTMIEIPRAALTAGELAKEAQFFSFGTNDLTQMTLGLSRDDSGSFLPRYVEKGIFKQDPFVSIDEAGVGVLVQFATTEARKVVSDFKVGICGEQGGDTATIEFCHRLGFNYVSCSPFRVPVARLAAAQAQLKNR